MAKKRTDVVTRDVYHLLDLYKIHKILCKKSISMLHYYNVTLLDLYR